MKFKDYSEYVLYHRKGVISTWEKILRPVLISECIDESIITEIDGLVRLHDQSKLSGEEFGPYHAHALDPEGYPKSLPDYRRAWNHHQKSNPHHWQYWVLMEDIENPKMIALEMDFKYVIEMLCDWESASNYYGNTARGWYESQGKNMMLHPATRELIEKYLVYLD